MRLRSRWDLLAAAPLVVAVLVALAAVLPPASGPLALVLILEEHLLLGTLLVLVPVALLARARLLGVALVLLAIVGVAAFGDAWLSLPSGGRHDLTVMSWNLQYGVRQPADQAAQLETADVDLIALQELEPDAAAAIEADAVLTARYPYRSMSPRWRAFGAAILSRYPIRDAAFLEDPARLKATVVTPRGEVTVVNCHTMPAAIRTATPLRLPIDFDPSYRDRDIGLIRATLDASLTGGERLLVLGDFNTSPTEAEYSALTAGLRDTHREVGEGPGWTWRPSRFTFLPVAFLRIDLQLTAGAIHPATTWVDCQYQGDHCRLFATYQID